MYSRWIGCVLVLFAAVSLAPGTTVWLNLLSSVHNTVVAPGTAVEWSIWAGVSHDDNAGLSLVVCDLVQDPNNPAFLDLPHADPASIPALLQGFNPPAGIANSPDPGLPTGYVGVQRGSPGRKDLRQIGGAQNTFGRPGENSGIDVDVEPGIGQSGFQLVVRGSFAAPDTPGEYRFHLSNAVANVLNVVQAPPRPSTVVLAPVDVNGGHLRFTVAPGNPLGDLNCNGSLGFDDINAFVLALSNPAGYATQYPGCDRMLADCNGNGTVGFEDINAFIALLAR